MREFKFVSVHPEDFPMRLRAWEDGEIPSSVPSFRTVTISIFHYDYFMARAIADLKFNTWKRENGY